MGRKYYDEKDLVDAAELIKHYCRQHICERCPFSIVFIMDGYERRICCELRRIPKDWELGGEEVEQDPEET